MNGCGNVTTGRVAADNICKMRYSMDVNSTHRTRILTEYGTEPIHAALIATAGLHPQDLDIRGKISRAVMRPNEDMIANGWYEFFQFNAPTMQGILPNYSDAERVWTGLDGNVADGFIIHSTERCGDWIINTGNGRVGFAGDINNWRLAYTRSGCNATNVNLLCITH